jgi:hypothetical protein
MSITRRIGKLEKLDASGEVSRAAKDRRLLELIATGALRRRGGPPRDISRASESELLSIIGATTRAQYDAALHRFAEAHRLGEYADLPPAREVRA